MRVIVRCPAFCHMSILPYIQSAQTPRVIIGVLLLAGFVCVLAMAIIEAKHVMETYSDKSVRSHRQNGKPITIAVGTDVENPALHYGIVVDCGSSGSRVYVYFWPPHSGNIQELLNIQQMRDEMGDLVVKKIEPGISVYADSPSGASSYLLPLLEFAAKHVPEEKHKETPLYIMATAGLRMLTESEQIAIMEDLQRDIPLSYNFLFTESHAEVISGKQEGVYAWISMNFILGKFEHMVGDDPLSIVNVPGAEQQTHIRKRTAGIIDMGGGSVQIAFEVPQSVRFEPQEDVAKNLLAEFNLGCRGGDMDHKYRIYVTTFLGFGGNAARKRYEKLLISTAKKNEAKDKIAIKQIVDNQNDKIISKNILNSTAGSLNGNAPLEYHRSITVANQGVNGLVGLSESNPILDPCLPVDLIDMISYNGQNLHVKGVGEYSHCQELLKPLLNTSEPCIKEPCSMNGVYQPEIDTRNSEFYGFSEYYYTMEDILKISGSYEYLKFQKAAAEYCSTKWSTIQNWSEEKLYPRADENRYRLQCFKSAWMTTVLHDGFKIPKIYKFFTTAQLVNRKEVHWSLGALLYKTRYYPLSEIQRHESHRYRPPWDVSQLPQSYNLLILCCIIVLAAILIYVRRLRLVKSAHLHKVPTMAYFMTEQDQLEEGILVKNFGNTFYS